MNRITKIRGCVNDVQGQVWKAKVATQAGNIREHKKFLDLQTIINQLIKRIEVLEGQLNGKRRPS